MDVDSLGSGVNGSAGGVGTFLGAVEEAGVARYEMSLTPLVKQKQHVRAPARRVQQLPIFFFLAIISDAGTVEQRVGVFSVVALLARSLSTVRYGTVPSTDVRYCTVQ